MRRCVRRKGNFSAEKSPFRSKKKMSFLGIDLCTNLIANFYVQRPARTWPSRGNAGCWSSLAWATGSWCTRPPCTSGRAPSQAASTTSSSDRTTSSPSSHTENLTRNLFKQIHLQTISHLKRYINLASKIHWQTISQLKRWWYFLTLSLLVIWLLGHMQLCNDMTGSSYDATGTVIME